MNSLPALSAPQRPLPPLCGVLADAQVEIRARFDILRTLDFIETASTPTQAFGPFSFRELSELVDLDALSLASTLGEDGLWHFTKSCTAGNSNFETRQFSELVSARWCSCHRNANRFSTVLQDLAPLPDLFAQPVFHSPEEAATWAGLFLSVLKTTDLISESSFQRAVELVHRVSSPPRLPSSGTLVMVARGARVEMVPHLFRTALHNALVHDPRGSSLVLVRQALPVSLFEGPSLLPSSLFHLVSLHAHRDEAERCAHLTMRLYDNGTAGLTPAEAYKAARALVEP